jgi:hypothetical protein
MLGFENKKDRSRYYLLPGMGGAAARRKHKLMVQWAIFAGLVVSALLAVALYLASRSTH